MKLPSIKWPTFDVWRNTNRNWDRHQLEKEIARSLLTMDGHESMGVPRGDARYISIADHVNSGIRKFCLKWGVTESAVRLQIPGLIHLDEMTKPNVLQQNLQSNGFKAFAALAIAVFCVILLPLLMGIFARFYHLAAGR